MLLYPVKISLQMIFTNCSDLLRGNPKHIGGGGGGMGGGNQGFFQAFFTADMRR